MISMSSNTVLNNLKLDVANLARYGVQVNPSSTNVRISYNVVKNVTQGGNYSGDMVVGIWLPPGQTNPSSKYITIDHNSVTNVRAKQGTVVARGIGMGAYRGNPAQNVIVSYNYVSDIYPKDDGDGIWYDTNYATQANSQIIYNYTERTAKRGIKMQTGGILIKGNHVVNSFNCAGAASCNSWVNYNPVPGLDMYSGISLYNDNQTAEDNLVEGVGSTYAGIEVSMDTAITHNVKIYNNTVTSASASGVSVGGTTAIRVGNVDGLDVKGNKVYKFERGVWVWQGAKNGTFTYNDISQVSTGIDFRTSLTGQTWDRTVTQSNNTIRASGTAFYDRP